METITNELTRPEQDQFLVNTHFAAAAQYWNDVYADETVSGAIYRQRQKAVLRWLEELPISREDKALDLGCGAGLFTVALAEYGWRVHAIDAVDAMLKQTSALACTRGFQERVSVQLGDAHNLSFPDSSFSLVLAIGIAPWLHSLSQALDEIYRVLKPGGHLIITGDNSRRLSYWLDPRFFPLHASLRVRVGKLLRKFGMREQPHAYMYPVCRFDRYLHCAGFAKLKSETLGYGPFTCFEHPLFSQRVGISLDRRLKNLSAHSSILRSLGSQYLVLGQKLR
ncbi:MAG TPA: class I SAM-dependent methyltransferase [Terriglobales bacterium]|nr:class I SAM-dependent methyltransferase [Terriglobales bacterium]